MTHFSKHLHLALRIKLRNLTGEIAALYSAVENSFPSTALLKILSPALVCFEK